MTNNDKPAENLAVLQQLKNLPIDPDLPPVLIMESHQTHLIDNFDLIKQRYSSLADFHLSRGSFLCHSSRFASFIRSFISDGKQLRIVFKPEGISVSLESSATGRQSETWKSK